MQSIKRYLGPLVCGLMAFAAFVGEVPKKALDSLAAHAARCGLALQVNTITNLIPSLYAALDVVSRELVGFIPAVSRDSSAERAAKNQTLNIFIAPPIVGADVVPGTTPPNDGDAVIGNTTMTIQKSRYWPVRWNGEEQRAAVQTGLMNNVIRDQFTQAFRASCNEVELDLANLAINASRAYGTAAATPFGTLNDFSDFAGVSRILDDNGAPTSDRQLVLGNAAVASIRGKQALLFRVNESGSAALLRQGTISELPIQGYGMHASGQVPAAVVSGTGA